MTCPVPVVSVLVPVTETFPFSVDVPVTVAEFNEANPDVDNVPELIAAVPLANERPELLRFILFVPMLIADVDGPKDKPALFHVAPVPEVVFVPDPT